jgi:signal peptidase I
VTYYNLVRAAAYRLAQSGDKTTNPIEMVEQEYHTDLKARPVDKRENYIKRCVAVPGDKLEMKNGVLFINDKKAYEPENIYLPYFVTIQNNYNVSVAQLADYDVEDMSGNFGPMPDHNILLLRMTNETVEKFKKFSWVKEIKQFTYPPHDPMEPVADVFPNDFKYYRWNIDNFGPVTIPHKGGVLQLNDSTLCQYKRLIEIYEGNKLEQKDGKIYINGKETTQYTCKLDYYWMMGDNRSNSADSRFWGFVPEDHIVGKAWFIWLSINYKAEDFIHRIRWNRILTNIHNKWAPKSE